jgi:hypothetical protein
LPQAFEVSCWCLPITVVAVEKGTNAVISANFTACGQRTFNHYERILRVKFPEKSF